jgi:hypothetical protein
MRLRPTAPGRQSRTAAAACDSFHNADSRRGIISARPGCSTCRGPKGPADKSSREESGWPHLCCEAREAAAARQPVAARLSFLLHLWLTALTRRSPAIGCGHRGSAGLVGARGPAAVAGRRGYYGSRRVALIAGISLVDGVFTAVVGAGARRRCAFSPLPRRSGCSDMSPAPENLEGDIITSSGALTATVKMIRLPMLKPRKSAYFVRYQSRHVAEQV